MAKGSGLAQPVEVSEELYEIVGKSPTTRAHITKMVWKYIKENDLNEGRQIYPDEVLAACTQTRPFDMMKLPGLLKDHITPA